MLDKIVLADMGIVFDEKDHTYTRKSDGMQFEGVTHMLTEMLGLGSVDNIPKHNLIVAAQRGNVVHDSIDYATSFDLDTEDLTNEESVYYPPIDSPYFNETEKKYGITLGTNPRRAVEIYRAQIAPNKVLCTEYLVTDGEKYASKVDSIVYVGVEDDCIIVDIDDHKSWSKPMPELIEKTRWQLSLYAHWTEKQNTKVVVEGKEYKLKVRSINISHNPQEKYGKGSRINVERISDDEIERMLQCAKNNEQFSPSAPFSFEQKALIQGNTNIISNKIQAEIYNFLQEAKEIKERETDLKERFLKLMTENGIKKFGESTDPFTITLVEATESKTFDTTRFKKEHPEMVDEYMKTSKKSAYVSFKLNN